MARTVIGIALDGSEGASGTPATGDGPQAAITAAIAAATAARVTATGHAGGSFDSTADIAAVQTKIDLITAAVAAALASQPSIVLDYDASLTRHQLQAALQGIVGGPA